MGNNQINEMLQGEQVQSTGSCRLTAVLVSSPHFSSLCVLPLLGSSSLPWNRLCLPCFYQNCPQPPDSFLLLSLSSTWILLRAPITLWRDTAVQGLYVWGGWILRSGSRAWYTFISFRTMWYLKYALCMRGQLIKSVSPTQIHMAIEKIRNPM